MKKKIAFICIHNSARSQMAEELLRKYAGDRFECFSGGIESGSLNPIVVDVLKEEGIDISNKKPKSVQDLINSGYLFDFVVTVCDEGNAERCPLFPGEARHLHWGFQDPSSLDSDVDRKQVTFQIKQQIKSKIMEWINSND